MLVLTQAQDITDGSCRSFVIILQLKLMHSLKGGLYHVGASKRSSTTKLISVAIDENDQIFDKWEMIYRLS